MPLVRPASHGSHAHGGHAPARSRSDGEGWSLLRASLGERLAGAAVILAGLWTLVAWAMQS